MSIEAIVSKVEYRGKKAILHLEGIDGEGPGQKTLTVLNPKPHMNSMEGICLWGNSSKIMIGETEFAKRIGYTEIELVER